MRVLLPLVLLPLICTAASVDRVLDAPDGSISGLAWGEGKLWCLDSGSSMCYGLDPVSGDVDVSFSFNGYGSYTPGGLAYYDGDLFGSFYNGGSSTYVYWYSTSGSYGGYDLFC
jgi:hypothetical protein